MCRGCRAQGGPYRGAEPEVVVIELDFGAFGDLKAHLRQDRQHVALRLRDRVQAADGPRRPGNETSIEPASSVSMASASSSPWRSVSLASRSARSALAAWP